jgi:tetratricopeptide (TPR) repeat protein
MVGIAYTDKPYGALMLDELEDYQEVIASLSAHIERGVSVGAALHNRGLARWEIGEPGQALRHFDEAAVQLPQSHMPFQLKGMLLQKLDRPDEALDSFNRAVSVSPNQATVRRARALLLCELGRPKEALKDFEHAIALEPGFARTREDRDAALAVLAKMPPKPWWMFWR